MSVALAAISISLSACAPTPAAEPSSRVEVLTPAPLSDAGSASPPPTTTASKENSDAKKSSGGDASPGAYYWSPEVVSIPGTLVRKSIEYSNGEVPVVVFDLPIRIENKPGTDTAPPLVAKEAWLSYNGIDKASVNKLVGKKVVYRGQLNPMQTAHHLSNPWLDGTVTAR